MAEERPFEVVDRRRVRAEGEPAAEAAAAAETPGGGGAAEPETAGAETVGAEAGGGEAAEPRAAGAEAAAAGDTAEAPPPPEEPRFEEPGAAGAGLPEITVGGILHWAAGILIEKAWVHMGLHPDPITGKMDRNLAEARRAIDVVADLAKHLEAELSLEERRELQRVLSDLRLNFVRQSSQG